MRIITTPDNEREVWEGAYRIGYIENDCLYLVGGEIVGVVEDDSKISAMIHAYRTKKVVQVVSRPAKRNVIKWN